MYAIFFKNLILEQCQLRTIGILYRSRVRPDEFKFHWVYTKQSRLLLGKSLKILARVV